MTEQKHISKPLKIAVYMVPVILVFLFSILIPYSGDDWAWGSSEGIKRLTTLFNGYNGRYFSDLLIIVMSRYKAISVIAIAGGVSCIAYLLSRYAHNDQMKLVYYYISFLLLFFLPIETFRQTIGWASGFSNYAVPAIFSLLLFRWINIIIHRDDRYRAIDFILTFFAGFIGSVIIEHTTVMHAIVCVLSILYIIIKKRKLFTPLVTFLFGTLIGGILMFINPAYGIFTGQTDAVRSIMNEQSVSDIFKDNYKTVAEFFLQKNYVLNVLILFSLIVFTYTIIKNRFSKKTQKSVLLTAIGIISAYFVFSAVGLFFPNALAITDIGQDNPVNPIYIATAISGILLFAFPLFALGFSFDGFLLSLPALSAFLQSVPLLVITPIGPRCLLPSYIFLICYAFGLLSYSLKRLNFTWNAPIQKATAAVLVGAVALTGYYYGSVYIKIASVYHVRTEYLEEQKESEFHSIVIVDYPEALKPYIWMPNPKSKLYIKRFKEFYGLDPSVELQIIPFSIYKEFNSIE